MRFKHAIILVSLCVACGGTGQKRSSSSKYNFSFKSRYAETFSPSTCPRDKHVVTNWKDGIQKLNACVSKKDWNKVDDLALQLRALDEKSPWGYYYSSLSSEARKNLPESMWFIHKALDRDAGNPLFQYQVGRLLLIDNNENDAFLRFKEALRLDPDHVEANLMVAKIYFNNKVYEAALRHYEKYLKEERSDEAIEACYISAMQIGDYVKSLDYLRKFPRNKHRVETKLNMAYLYEKTNDLQSAIEVYEDVLKQNKGQNTSFDSRHVSDKIRELQTQLRSIAAAKEGKGFSQ